jgi:hypothetical protein
VFEEPTIEDFVTAKNDQNNILHPVIDALKKVSVNSSNN